MYRVFVSSFFGNPGWRMDPMPKSNMVTKDDVVRAIEIAARIVGLATETKPQVVLEEYVGIEMKMYEMAMAYLECGIVKLRGIG